MSVLIQSARFLRVSSLLYLTLGVAATSPLAISAEIEEIVVTARALEESIRDIPVAITTIGEKRMNQFAIESMMDLEALTPQLTIGRGTSGSGTSINIRGIYSTWTSIGIEQSVAVIIDGVYFPQGRAINEGLFDSKLVSVLKGPQALYFGKNATAGVISVETNDPGEEFEASLRINNEFESDDLTVEAMISVPVNDKFGLRLAVQASDMDKGWIKSNSAAGGDSYGTIDAFTGGLDFWDNPRTVNFFPQEETLYVRLTAAGDLSDSFSYNVKGSYSKFEQGYTGGGELFDCSTLNGTAHNSQLAAVQPPGRQTPLYEPLPLPIVDCKFDGSRGWNDVPPEIAAVNPLLNQFGSGDAGEEYESWIVTTSLNWQLEKFDVSAILNYHDQNTQWVGDQDGGEITSIFAGEENKFENFSAEFRVVTHFDQPLNFVLGIYYQDTNLWFDQDVIFAFVPIPGVGVFGPRNSDPAIANPDNEFTAYNKLSETDGKTESIYTEVVWDINDSWQLTAGVRYHHETKDSYFIQPYVHPFVTGLFIPYVPGDPATRPDISQTFKDWIPEVTLRWELSDNITVYAAYKEGFKSGGFSNSAILSNLSPPGFFDFTFDPEHNRGGEIGLKASLLDNSVLTSFEVFYYKFRDLQVDFFNSQQFAYVTENAGGSITSGAEWQADWATPMEGLTLSGSIGYLISEFTSFENFCYVGQRPDQGCTLMPGQNEADVRQNLDGNTRPGAPKWSGFLAANYERQIGNGLVFGVTANIQFKSETVLSSNDPNATYESYRTYDANIRLSTVDGKWKLALIGKNLSDERAIRGAGNVPSTGGNTGTPEGFRGDLNGSAIRGRQVELELTYNY